MRHKVKRQSLGKDRQHRLSILRNLAIAFLLNEKIKTTQTKGRLFRSYVEKIITRAKVDSLHNRRLVFQEIKNTRVIKKLFEDIAKRYLTRPGGYTKTYKLGFRAGDSSEMVQIELVPEFLEQNDDQERETPKKKSQPKEKKAEGKEKAKVENKAKEKEAQAS